MGDMSHFCFSSITHRNIFRLHIFYHDIINDTFELRKTATNSMLYAFDGVANQECLSCILGQPVLSFTNARLVYKHEIYKYF